MDCDYHPIDRKANAISLTSMATLKSYAIMGAAGILECLSTADKTLDGEDFLN